MTTTSTGLGGRVRSLREQAGLSAGALAERSGVNRQTITSIESGSHVPNLRTVERVAQGLGLTLGQLVGGAGLDGSEER